MSKWREVRLGEIVNLSQGLAINKQSRHLQTDDSSELPLLRISDMKNGTVEKYIKKEVSEKFIATKSDIIYTRTGQVGLVFTGQSGVIHNNCFKIIPDNKLVNKSFLYWILKNKYIYNYVNILASGAAQPDLTHSKFKNIKFKIPDLETQEKIAHVLSSYDELIENNNRRIELLENMAEEIYKEWFVRMRFPGHEKTKFVKGIPEGWEVKKIGEFAKLVHGYTQSASEFKIGPKFLRGTDINKNSYIDWQNVPYCEIDKNIDKYRLNKEDIVIIRMADPGKVAIIEEVINSVFASYLIKIDYDKHIICPYYMFYSLYTDGYQEQIKSLSNGTTRSSINSKMILNSKVLVADFKTQQKFNHKISVIRQKLNNLLLQNQNLIKQRDMLLPRLMNGTIEVN